MKLYLYYKLDRGFYEFAYAQWRREGGDFAQHLLHTHLGLVCWEREFLRLGMPLILDLRSSFLLPQTRRRRLPLTLARFCRAVLWGTKFDPWLLQRDLVRRITELNPAVAFFPLGSSVWESTLSELKHRGVRLVQLCDMPSRTMLARDRVNLKYFDLIIEIANFTESLRAAGAEGRIEYVPIGIDPEFYRPLSLSRDEYARYQSDVCFIGGLGTRFHSARRQIIEYAIQHGVSMKIWGGYRQHFIGSPILKCWQGQIWGVEQVKALCAAKIGLNFHLDHQPGEHDRGLNSRAFELAACGVFQLLQYVPSLPEFFEEGKEIVTFQTQEEMIDKIRYYLAHPDERERIAAAARTRVLRDHTWGQRVERMVRYIQDIV